jgi:glycosyltransferase involved in cell wall biosynthesis
MRLAIVIPGFQTSEQDWCIPAFTNLAREMTKSNEVHVFALRYPHVRRSYKIGRVWVHAIGGGAIGGRRFFGASLLRLWRETLRHINAVHRRRQFDVIIGIWATESGWLATKAAHSLGVPSLVHLAGGELVWLPQIGYGTRRKSLPAILVRGALANANVVTAPSTPMRNRATESGLITAGRLKKWALGVDTDMFKPSDQSSREVRPFTFVAVGSLIAVKGYELLLASFAELLALEHTSRACLRIVGSGPLESELRNLAKRLYLEGYVDFVGEVWHSSLSKLYQGSDCFVISSWHEAQCMAALESMACGLPWIAPAVGALADVPSSMDDTPTGIRVIERDPAKFAGAMQAMMSLPPEVRTEWGRNGRTIIETSYALSTQTQRLLQLLGELSAPV